MLQENDINKKGNDAKEPHPISRRGHEDIDPSRIFSRFLLSTPSTFTTKKPAPATRQNKMSDSSSIKMKELPENELLGCVHNLSYCPLCSPHGMHA
jgi:hypothetical protein